MRVPIWSSAAHRCIEVAILVENGSFKLLQGPSRLETQLVQQKAAGVLVGTQRLGLPPASVEGQHQLATKTLAERMLRGEPLEFAHHLGMALPLEVGLESFLEAVEPQLLESCDLVLGEAVEGDVGEGSPTPQAERRSERACCGIGVSGRTGFPPLGEQARGPFGIELSCVHLEDVAPWTGVEAVPRTKRTPHARDVCLERFRRSRRGPAGVQILDDPVGGHDLVAVQDQNREQRTLARTA
jgi:hypothetical protein